MLLSTYLIDIDVDLDVDLHVDVGIDVEVDVDIYRHISMVAFITLSKSYKCTLTSVNLYDRISWSLLVTTIQSP